jgi:hypothetical protein
MSGAAKQTRAKTGKAPVRNDYETAIVIAVIGYSVSAKKSTRANALLQREDASVCK